MNYGQAVCDNEKCDNTYSKRTSNQRYCGEECRKIVTNKNLMGKYHEEKDRKRGKVRHCSRCKETKLSRYNSSTICNNCVAQAKKDDRDVLLAMFNGS